MTDETKPSANDRQVGGKHYVSAYQHWDFVLDAKLGYFEGQITKYLSRHRKKNGLQDAEKALHFAEKLLEATLDGRTQPQPSAGLEPLQRFLTENKIEGEERAAISLVSRWVTVQDLRDVVSGIKKAIIQTYDKE